MLPSDAIIEKNAARFWHTSEGCIRIRHTNYNYVNKCRKADKKRAADAFADALRIFAGLDIFPFSSRFLLNLILAMLHESPCSPASVW